MPLSAQEQYLLELINRGRMNPAAEAARYGIDLNAGLAAGTISTVAKQVLAPNELLEQASIKHAQWMLATDVFSHTGANGSTIATRANAEGYQWNLLGENIAVWGTTGTLNVTAAIDAHHKGLFLSAGHRTNLMNATLSEVGLAQESGKFAFSGPGTTEYNSSMVAQLFGANGASKFLTGVAYTDLNKDGMYSVGEGKANTVFSVAGLTDVTEVAGGYSVGVASVGTATVTGRAGKTDFSVVVDFSSGSAKLDVVNDKVFQTSVDVMLVKGIANVDQLGIANLTAEGNAARNTMNGNAGANVLAGYAGHDVIDGRSGDDNLFGGIGNDRVFGSEGNDRLIGDAGADYLMGGTGQDLVNGGLGGDRFVFSNSNGSDVYEDFSLAQRDRLMLNDDLWTGRMTAAQVVNTFASVTSAGVVFDFGDGDAITLSGVTSTAGLAGAILFW